MPKIDFSFQGWVRGAEVEKASTPEGDDVDVSKMPAEVLAKKLEKGELTIALGDYLYDNHHDCEIEMHDYEEPIL